MIFMIFMMGYTHLNIILFSVLIGINVVMIGFEVIQATFERTLSSTTTTTTPNPHNI